jgi:hypothetical protein
VIFICLLPLKVIGKRELSDAGVREDVASPRRISLFVTTFFSGWRFVLSEAWTLAEVGAFGSIGDREDE